MQNCDDVQNMKIPPIMGDTKPPSITLEKCMPSTPIKVTDENFSSVIQDYDFVIVDCWAPWCGPCSMLSPTIDELAKDYEGDVVFGKLNTDMNRSIPTQLDIMSIPTLLFIKNGRLVDKIIGAVPKSVIEDKIRKYL
jgi:thioredoxin 1